MFKKGFTLVEILIVLVIIGILLSFFVVNGIKSVDVANSKACASKIHTLDTALMMRYAQERTWDADLSSALCAYLPAEMCKDGAVDKTCPFGGEDYTTESTGDGAALRIKRSAHFNDGSDVHL